MLNNNAFWELLWSIGASTTTMSIKDSKWWLFPTTFPYRLTIEQLSNSLVTKREIVEVTNKTGDTFTITRAVETCPLNSDAITQTQTAQSFTDGALVQMRFTWWIYNDLYTEVYTNIPADLSLKLDKTTYNSEKIAYASSSTWNDDYVVSISDVISLTDWQTFKIKADVWNTWTATLNVNSLWAKTLKKLKASAFADLETGDLIANQIYFAIYNSSNGWFFQFSIDVAQVVVPDVGSTKSTIVAWENITSWNALYIHTDWKVYKTDASNSSKINFVWFATNTISSWWNVVVDTSWISNTQSWLTAWSNYYLTSTAWAISTTAWTNIAHIWTAISWNLILLKAYEQIKSWTWTKDCNEWNAAIVITHNLWKIPKIINMISWLSNSNMENNSSSYYYNNVNLLNWNYIWQYNSMYKGTTYIWNQQIEINTSNIFYLTLKNWWVSYTFTWTISNITATQMTLNYTKTWSWSPNCSISYVWKVE